MGLLRRIASFLSEGGGSDEDRDVHWEYVRCSRCGEMIPVRVDLRNELTAQEDSSEGAYYVRKGVIGSGKNRCFATIEVELYLDFNRRVVSRYISGGEFITKDEFEAEADVVEDAGQDAES
jgi:hypothetical protein